MQSDAAQPQSLSDLSCFGKKKIRQLMCHQTKRFTPNVKYDGTKDASALIFVVLGSFAEETTGVFAGLGEQKPEVSSNCHRIAFRAAVSSGSPTV